MKTVQSTGRYYTKSKWSTIESAHVVTSFGALGSSATDDVVFAKGCGQLAKRHTQMRSRFPPAKDERGERKHGLYSHRVGCVHRTKTGYVLEI